MDAETTYVAGASALAILAAQAQGAPPHVLALACCAAALMISELHARRTRSRQRRETAVPKNAPADAARALAPAAADADAGRVAAVIKDVRALDRALSRAACRQSAERCIERAADLRDRAIAELDALSWARPEERRIWQLMDAVKARADAAILQVAAKHRARVFRDPSAPAPAT